MILFYTIDPSVPPPDRPTAWDIEVKAEDVFLKNRMGVMLQTNRESAQNLVKLDEEVIDLYLLPNLTLTWIADSPSCPVTP